MLKLSGKWFFHGIFTLLFFSGVLPGCEFFNNSMVDYFLDNTRYVEVTEAGGRPQFVFMTDGTILIPPAGEEPLTTIELTLFNPRNLMVRQELLGVPEGKNISAEQIGAAAIEVRIAEAAEQDEYALTLAMQSPDGLRDFPAFPLEIKCVSFETGLRDLSVDGVTPPAFNPVKDDFTMNVPYTATTVTLGAETVHPDAKVELYAGADDSGADPTRNTHSISQPVSLDLGNNYFYLKITAQSTNSRGYVFTIYRGSNPNKAITDFYIASGGKYYGTGAGLPVEAGSGTIDEAGHAITVTVPYGTALGALSAKASHTGASIAPDPEEKRSYEAPVTYTVTATDGSTQAYTVTAAAAKIAGLGDIIFSDGFIQTGADISGTIKAAISSVTGTDGLNRPISLYPDDYSVDSLTPTEPQKGTFMTATLRVPADRSSTGAALTKEFTVYIESGDKEITEFYFTASDEKRYGTGTGVVDGSASVSGNSMTITLPYRTDTSSLPAATVTLNHAGALISPDPAKVTDYGSPVSYTVTAADGTEREYKVTVEAAKIASLGNIDFDDGFKQTGSDISGDIKAAITSVEGTDRVGTAIYLAAEDYSVDTLNPSAFGDNTATLRVPATSSSTGGDITKGFTVYVKNWANDITAFYFTIGGKYYGWQTTTGSVSLVAGSGGISGTDITVKKVPYGTNKASLPSAATVKLSPKASIDPNPATITDYGNSQDYTVTAEDGTKQKYTVTVTVADGITISGITNASLQRLTFSGESGSLTPLSTVTVTASTPTPITITISGGTVTEWTVDIYGPETQTASDSSLPILPIQFTAPGTKGYYSVNVFATVGDVLYSGSFGMRVE